MVRAPGQVTDVYFVRTSQILQAKRIDTTVCAEVVVKALPPGDGVGVLAGLEQAAEVAPDAWRSGADQS